MILKCVTDQDQDHERDVTAVAVVRERGLWISEKVSMFITLLRALLLLVKQGYRKASGL